MTAFVSATTSQQFHHASQTSIKSLENNTLPPHHQPTMAQKTRVLLVGSGGIGTITALNLELSGQCSVTAVLRSNYSAVKEKGFTIDAMDYGRFDSWRPSHILDHIPNVTEEKLEPFDYICCTTKNVPDVPPTLADLIAPAVTKDSVIVLIQNGVNIEKPLQKAFPSNIILSGVSRMGANEPTLGHIVQDDADRLWIGPFHNPNLDPNAEKQAAEHFVSLYQKAGKAQCEYNPDVAFVRWRKLLYNCVWNPICALSNLDTGRFRLAFSPDDPTSPVETLIRPAMHEVRAVAKGAAGIELDESLVDDMVTCDPIEIFCAPSMLQDARKGRFIEVENILGEVCREAKKAGVQIPTITVLYGLLRARQWATMEKQGLVRVEEEMKKTTQK